MIDPTVLQLLQDLGFPLWAGVVLWAAIAITRMVRDGLTRLEKSNLSFEQRFAVHIAESDKRMALIEALLQSHDREIHDLKQATNGNNHAVR